MPPLSQLLPPFVLPLGAALILAAIGLATRRRWLTAIALIVLWLASTPITARPLARFMEGGNERMLAAAPTADAIVVLSGGRFVAPGPAAVSEWRGANRFFGGLELFDAGRAPLLVFTGGWSPRRPEAPTEGQILASWAERWGVAPERILVTERVTNTAEEAAAVASLVEPFESRRILLVTSAFHTQRARVLFERAGLEVIAFPVDFQVSEDRRFGITHLLPGAGALRLNEQSLREALARTVYRAW